MAPSHNINLYNTLTRTVQPLIPISDDQIGLYACGPTVYDYPHIGHIRRYIFDDVLVRFMRYLGYAVTHVMNVTDVGHLVSDADTGEDKLEKGARREGKTAWDVARYYEIAFFEALDRVSVRRPDIICRATDHIPEQISLIQTLETKRYTYKIADGVYFDTSKFSKYGELARLNATGLKPGARVEMVPGKKQPTDFALWKFTPAGQKRDMEWESPWGVGFPGWHIECSAMSLKYLGHAFAGQTFKPEAATTIDLHSGGIDHIPVHHPNEIAQSEAATGKQFVGHWMHHNFLLVNGEKMSKSLGNFITVDEVIKKGFNPLALRYLFLQTHYRQESNFTWEALAGAQNALAQLTSQIGVTKQLISRRERTALSDEKLDKVNDLRVRFKEALRNDLNTAQALSIVWEMIKTNVPANDKYDLLLIADEILGLNLKDISGEELMEETVPQDIKELGAKREALRKAQKWQEADIVRQEIAKKGWIIKDGPQGFTFKKG